MSDIDELLGELRELSSVVDDGPGPHPDIHVSPFGAGVHWLPPGQAEPWQPPTNA